MSTRSTRLAATLAALLSAAAAQAQEIQFISGLEPDKRPASAPSVDSKLSSAPRTGTLHGISAPHPKSLRFVRDQGTWYTPFTIPGMTGRYDLRDYHGRGNPEDAPMPGGS